MFFLESQCLIFEDPLKGSIKGFIQERWTTNPNLLDRRNVVVLKLFDDVVIVPEAVAESFFLERVSELKVVQSSAIAVFLQSFAEFHANRFRVIMEGSVQHKLEICEVDFNFLNVIRLLS